MEESNPNVSNETQVTEEVVKTTPVTETTEQNTVQPNLGIEEKPKNNLAIIGIAAIVIIIAVLGGIYYYFGKTDTVITNFVNSVFGKATDLIDAENDFDITKDSFIIDGDLVVDTNIDGFEDLKKEKIKFNLGLDYKNEKAQFGATLIENKKDIVSAMGYLIDDEVFIDLKDEYKGLINYDEANTDFSDIFDLEELEDVKFTTKDINTIIEEMNKVVVNSIEMDKIKKSSDTIEVDGKDVKVSKYSYKLNEKNSQKFVKSIIKNIIKDDKLIEKLSLISNTDEDDIIDSLKESLENIDEIDEIGTINIYTKGLTNEFVKFELVNENGKLSITNNKETYDLVLSVEDMKVNATIKELNNEKIDITFNVKADDQKFSGSIVANAKTTKNTTKSSAIINIKYNDYKVKATLNTTTKLKAKVADVNTKKAVDYSDLSYSEINKISTNLMKKIKKSNAYDIIENISSLYNSKSSSSYNYSYDDDDYDYSNYSFDYNY